jgi:hypothetical protein
MNYFPPQIRKQRSRTPIGSCGRGNSEIAFAIFLLILACLALIAVYLKETGRFSDFNVVGYIQLNQSQVLGQENSNPTVSARTLNDNSGRTVNLIPITSSAPANLYPSGVAITATIDGKFVGTTKSLDSNGVRGFFVLTFSNLPYGLNSDDFGPAHQYRGTGAIFNPLEKSIITLPLKNGSMFRLQVHDTDDPYSEEQWKKLRMELNSAIAAPISRQTLIQIIAASLVSLITFGLSLHYGSHIFPQDKESKTSQSLTVLVSLCLAGISGLVLFESERLADIIGLVAQEAASTAVLAIGIIFLGITGFLVIKKLKILLS